MTDTWLPDGTRSRIVLIGTSTHRHSKKLHPMPSVGANLADLHRAFTDPEYGILAERPEHCTVLGRNDTPVTQKEIGSALSRASDEAEDLLLIYYAGHGLLDEAGFLYLALHDTDPDPRQLGFTAVDLRLIKERLAGAKARNRVLILDCCFSGRAIAAMGPVPSLVRGQLPARGAYILTSTGANEPSYAPPEHRNTAFTGALLRALGQSQPLPLDEIYQYVSHELNGLGRTGPQCQAVGDATRIALARGEIPLPETQNRPPRRQPSLHLPVSLPLPLPLSWALPLPWVLGALGAAIAVTALSVVVWTATTGQGKDNESVKEPTATGSGTRDPAASTSPVPRKSASTPSASPVDGSPASTSQQLRVNVNGTKETADGSVTIKVTSAVGHIDENGESSVYGEGGETSGGGSVTADQAAGGGVVGFADFYIETPTRTCKARGVALGQSTVVTESSADPGPGKWTRITVNAVENADSGHVSVTFRVTQGSGRVPESSITCA